ncbi:MAG: transglycosylase SLT domain-containing protein, partial [Acidimicrobiia bacterium]
TDGGGAGGGGGDWDFPPAVERWRSLVQAYFPSNRVDEALAVLQCESLGDADAYNPYSGASGLYQFLPSTWASSSPKAGFSGASAFDAEANIGTAAWLANRYQELGQGFWSPWSCRRVLG